MKSRFIKQQIICQQILNQFSNFANCKLLYTFRGLLTLSNETDICFVPLVTKLISISSVSKRNNALLRKFKKRWHNHCHLINAMNIFDLIIIYLASGSPFAVNYYFQKSKNHISKKILLKSFFVFVFWLPYLVYYLLKTRIQKSKLTSKARRKFDFEQIAAQEKSLFSIQKQIEVFCFENDSQISIFEFRETCQRYAGLTFAVQNESGEATEEEKHFFQIVGKEKTELPAICLKRRNRKRLIHHQNLARKDFLQITGKLFAPRSDRKKLASLVLGFVTLLNDFEAQRQIEKSIVERSTNEKEIAVKRSKKVLWNRELTKPLPVEQTSLQMRTLKATMNSRGKD